jgi:hypothetical protein
MKKILCQKVNSSLIMIALFGIAVAVTSLDLVQSASATTNVMTRTLEEESSLNTTCISNNNNDNNSNVILGSLFLTGEDRLTSFNRINQTYTEVSYVGNRTIMPPPDSTNTTIGSAMPINATEKGNLTLKLQPNGITFVEGQSLLITEGLHGNNNNVRGGEQQQENAIALLVDLNGVRPDDPRSSTGVAFLAQTQLAG